MDPLPSSPDWVPASLAAAVRPPPGEVHLWRIDLQTGDAEADRALLSPAEQARADRFLDPEGRRRHVRGRAVLRRLLGQCLGTDPRALALSEGAHGKPFLGGGDDLHFNLSHSGETALVALAAGMEIGVDLEEGTRKVGAAGGVAARWFTPEEQAAWEAEARSPAAFLRLWTRKEAVMKAHGGGLAAGMDRFSVAAPLPGSRVLWPPAVLWEGTPYAVIDLAPGGGAVGALAVAGARTLQGLKLRTLL
jgi:4'-phosphopantetheinyl transferase